MSSLAVSSYNPLNPFHKLAKEKDLGLIGPNPPGRALGLRNRPDRELPPPQARVQTLHPTPGPIAPKPDEQSPLTLEASRFVTEYIYLIASLSDDVREGKTDFASKVEELSSQVVDPSTPQSSPSPVSNSGGDITEFALSAEFSLEQQSTISMVSDQNSFSLSASASLELHAELEASFKMADGSTVSLSVEAEIDINLEVQLQAMAGQAPVNKSDPLALDIDGDGDLSLTTYQNGLLFDINGDGTLDQTAFIGGADVFLALDKNGNGRIDDGHELFGDQNGSNNGFLELGRYDENGDGVIDAKDTIFSALQGVRLGNDGSVETIALQALGVDSLSLGYENTAQNARGGNSITQIGSYQTSDGQTRELADVLLNYV